MAVLDSFLPVYGVKIDAKLGLNDSTKTLACYPKSLDQLQRYQDQTDCEY